MLTLTRRSLNKVYDYAIEALCYGASESDLLAEIRAAIAETKRHVAEAEQATGTTGDRA